MRVVLEGGAGAVAVGAGGDPAVPGVVGAALQGAVPVGCPCLGEPAPGVVPQQQFVARRVTQHGGQRGVRRVAVADVRTAGGRQDEAGRAALLVVGAGEDGPERVDVADGASAVVPVLARLVAERAGQCHRPAERVEGVHAVSGTWAADGGAAVGVGELDPRRAVRPAPVDLPDRVAAVVGEAQRLPVRREPHQPALGVPPEVGDGSRPVARAHQGPRGVVVVRGDVPAERVGQADEAPVGVVAVQHGAPAPCVDEPHGPVGALLPHPLPGGEGPARAEPLLAAARTAELAHQPQRVLSRAHHQVQLPYRQLSPGQVDADLGEVAEGDPQHGGEPGRRGGPGRAQSGHVLGDGHGQLLVRSRTPASRHADAVGGAPGSGGPLKHA